MPALTLDALRGLIRDHYLVDEAALTRRLLDETALDETIRDRAQKKAADFVRIARANTERSGLIDKFLQEYGLSTKEGVTLMRLAEALLRTPDAATANALIEDKIEAGDWAAHKGKSPFPLVNFSTRALMLTAAWLDDVEANDPLRQMAAATKDVLDRLGEPVIRASVAQAMRIMGEHFVLGETIGAAMKRGAKYASKGYVFSFDMLGEAAHTKTDAEKYFHEYENAIEAIAEFSKSDKAPENPGISVKLSALHPRYEYSKKDRALKELGERVRALAIKAKAANMGFNIDAEEADRLDLSLDIIEMLMRDPALQDWAGFGVVVQAYQRRASFVIDWLVALSRETDRRIMVRLVKGAYWDGEIKRAQVIGLESYPVFTRKVLTDFSFLACARKLFAATDVFYPQFATHNALTAAIVQEMAGDYEDYELQRLHGMGEALHDSLVASGVRSRIYAPVGGHKELLPYLVRRLLENGANSSFVNQLIDPDLSVDDIVADPIEEITDLNVFANPNIPAPRDHLNGERLAAKGWDETHPPTAAQMTPQARRELSPIAACPIIDGKFLSGADEPVTNPANMKDIVGTVAAATDQNVKDACAAAVRFSPEWAATPAANRSAFLRRAADLLETRSTHFMKIAVFEAGKTWPDAISELREAVDFLRYYANRAKDLSGAPLGVVACISPWNFPLAIFLGQVSAALAAGNCAIAKPAGQTPLIAFETIKLLHEAGIPGGALHFLPGSGRVIGSALVSNAAVQGVVFTGSTLVAQGIKNSLVASGKHDAMLIAETGGINVMIVDSTALMEQAVVDTLSSAFQSAGQRCSACRVVCVQEDVADRFTEMLSGATAELSIGDPSKLSTDVGPVIDEGARRGIVQDIERLEREAKLITRTTNSEASANGTFIHPAAFEVASIRDLKQEIFGPVLHLVRYKANELDALIDDINAIGFGLTMGVHTRIDETMERVARRARIGNLYINRNQIGAVVGVQPFGGEGLSGTGPKAGGPHYLSAFLKRDRANGAAPVILSGDHLTPEEAAAITSAAGAYHSWNNMDRGQVLREAAASEAGKELLLGAKIYDAHFKTNIDLPGPTGESNTLKLRGRGVALCLGGGDDRTNARQIALALAAGNCVITNDSSGAGITDALSRTPQGAFATLAGSAFSKALLLDARVRAVIYDGDSAQRAELEAILAQRTGPIISLLSGKDDAWRFATERTLTINTTAAGGDVRLLSLGD